MPQLKTLVGQSKRELEQLARNVGLEGYSTLDKAGLIIKLCEPPPDEETKALLRMSSKKLTERARAEDLKGYSTLDKASLLLALSSHPSQDAGDSSGPPAERGHVVRIYHPRRRLPQAHPDGPYAGEVIGYAWPKDVPGIYTYLRGYEGVEEAAGRSETVRRALGRIMERPPTGAAVRDPSL